MLLSFSKACRKCRARSSPLPRIQNARDTALWVAALFKSVHETFSISLGTNYISIETISSKTNFVYCMTLHQMNLPSRWARQFLVTDELDLCLKTAISALSIEHACIDHVISSDSCWSLLAASFCGYRCTQSSGHVKRISVDQLDSVWKHLRLNAVEETCRKNVVLFATFKDFPCTAQRRWWPMHVKVSASQLSWFRLLSIEAHLIQRMSPSDRPLNG